MSDDDEPENLEADDEDMLEVRSFTVCSEHSGRRLDVVCMEILDDIDMSRVHLQRLIKDGHVVVNEAPSQSSYRVHPGDLVRVAIPQPQPLNVVAEAIPLTILHEDSSIIVINKPAGLSVHPGAGQGSGTLVNALLAHTTDLSGINGVLRPGIVHRLDKTTSGVIVVAKNDKAHLALARQFQSRETEKHYLALIHGNIIPPLGTIDQPIARHRIHRKKMTVDEKRGKEALTAYRLTRRFAHFDLLDVTPHHGRTHQIRVHLAFRGHPVVGDDTYGKGKRFQADSSIISAVDTLSGNALHAHSLTLTHPETGLKMTFTAPPPADFNALLDAIEQKDQAGRRE